MVHDASNILSCHNAMADSNVRHATNPVRTPVILVILRRQRSDVGNCSNIADA